MNNTGVKEMLDGCRAELENINGLVIGIQGGPVVEYIEKYAVIRVAGSIETGFKTLIADKVEEDSHVQIKNFIKKKIRESSCNPKLGLIERTLGEFDPRWLSKFDELLSFEDKPGLKGSLTQLVNARNDFAHGGASNISINEIMECFESGVKVLIILDLVVNYDFEPE